jgi:hypothetical protein
MSRYQALLTTILALCAPTLLSAQHPRFGIALGTSLVGGGDSRTVVNAGGFNVTGADQAGFHIRAMADIPLDSSAFTFRTELFYNNLHSQPNSTAFLASGEIGAAALIDRTFGLTGNFVAGLSPRARVSPYFLLGAGVFLSFLGTNPDRQSSHVATTRSGMGLGLQTGMGMRLRLGQRSLLVEWRYGQALNNTRGTGFMPLTIGLLF